MGSCAARTRRPMSNESKADEFFLKLKEECEHLDANSSIVDLGQKLCERVFDGYLCWPATVAGIVATQPCPNHNQYVKTTKNGIATKLCDDTGHWEVPEGFTRHWTNYSSCGTFYKEINATGQPIDDLEIYSRWLPIIKSVTQFGYVLSTISLITALFVFIHIKRLRCARNKLHVHLFISFILRALMSLLKDALFVRGTALPHDTEFVDGNVIFKKDNNSWVCKAITSSRNYFITTNYVFLLMEGAYLHNLLFMKRFSEDSVAAYYILGWSVPICFSIPWIILKTKYEDQYCWTRISNHYIALLIDIPIGLSVIINLILFIIIMKILFVKLTSMYIQQKKTKYKKLLKATSILVPLFGVPYAISVVLSFYAELNQTVEIIWLFFDQTFAAFHGLFASLAYCFLNTDVQVEIIRKYNSIKSRNSTELKRRTRTISHTQQVLLNEELQEFPPYKGKVTTHATCDYF